MTSYPGGLSRWLLLLMVTAGAVEMYDELADPGQGDASAINNIDTGPADPGEAGALLYTLFAPRTGKLFSFPYRSRWINSDYHEKGLAYPKKLGLDLVTDKRSTQKTMAPSTDNLNVRQQRRWKIKKGTQMVCYFKLCAFRPMT